MKKPLFTGACTAILTPFDARGNVDLDAFSSLVERQAAGGTSALAVCGTTGEAATLSPAEQTALIRKASEVSAGRMIIVAGIGGNDTKKALDAAQRAIDAGAEGLLMVTPYYNKTTQAGLIEHFSYVADRAEKPVILYNVPSRTGIGIAPETYAVLSEHPNINGVKEASGDIGAFARSIALCDGRLNFWSGNDSDTVAMYALGARGVVSVASNLVPEAVSRLCELCETGDYPAAARRNAEYMDLFHLLFCEVNPIPAKTAAELMGLCRGELRLPLVPMGRENKAHLKACLERHGLLP